MGTTINLDAPGYRALMDAKDAAAQIEDDRCGLRGRIAFRITLAMDAIQAAEHPKVEMNLWQIHAVIQQYAHHWRTAHPHDTAPKRVSDHVARSQRELAGR